MNLWCFDGIIDMSSLFKMASDSVGSYFNQDISNWDTTGVINMKDMFYGAIAFNQHIGNWDTAGVTNMELTIA